MVQGHIGLTVVKCSHAVAVLNSSSNRDSAAQSMATDDETRPLAGCLQSQPGPDVSSGSNPSLHGSSNGSSLWGCSEVDSSPDPLLKRAERAVSIRLLPPLLLLTIISYLDRTALSFASIQMSQDLNLSSSMYGLGSGAFFLAYAAGQIPSNFLLLRFGGPVWLACICVAWGVAASSMALVRGPVTFVMLRMLLGLAESGAFPGTWYYISCWYPSDRTTVPYTVIETGITVSQVVAAPIAAGLLLLDGKLGLKGWQWLFMLEGIPAVLLGCFIGCWLPQSIHTARFLSSAQQAALLKATAIGREPSPLPPPTTAHASVSQHEGASADATTSSSRDSSSSSTAEYRGNAPGWQAVLAVARNKVVLYAGSWRILHDIPGNGVLYWTPKIVQALLFAGVAGASAGSSSPGVAVVLLSAVPYAAASLAHLVNAWHSQRVGEVKLHISCTWLLGAVALLLLPFAASGALSGSSNSTGTSAVAGFMGFALLTVAHVGVNGANGLQTGLVAGCLRPEQKALGLAMYNTIACMGSFMGPLLIGIIHDATHGYRVAMWLLGCSLGGAAFMVYAFKGSDV